MTTLGLWTSIKKPLSDEFGIGMGGLLLESFFNAGEFVDISVALNDPGVYQDIQQAGTMQPDYLMWAEQPGSPYYVVECKGSQSGRATSFDQLRRGLEQVPSVVFGTGGRQIITLVVATCMEPAGTTVLVLDPPADSSKGPEGSDEDAKRVSERTGKRSWRITDFERFQQRSWMARESALLKWAGQYEQAVARDVKLEVRQRHRDIPQNVPLETKLTDFGAFRGRVSSGLSQ